MPWFAFPDLIQGHAEFVGIACGLVRTDQTELVPDMAQQGDPQPRQFPVERPAVQRRPAGGQGDGDGQEPGSLHPERVPVRRPGRRDRLLGRPGRVVGEHQADRGHPHGRPVAERPTREDRIR